MTSLREDHPVLTASTGLIIPSWISRTSSMAVAAANNHSRTWKCVLLACCSPQQWDVHWRPPLAQNGTRQLCFTWNRTDATCALVSVYGRLLTGECTPPEAKSSLTSPLWVNRDWHGLGTLSSKLQKKLVQKHFRPKWFHPKQKTISSNDTFIQKWFRPMTFSSKTGFIQ